MKIKLVPNSELKKRFKIGQTIYWLNDKRQKVFASIIFSHKVNKLVADVGYTWIPIIRERQYFILNSF